MDTATVRQAFGGHARPNFADAADAFPGTRGCDGGRGRGDGDGADGMGGAR